MRPLLIVPSNIYLPPYPTLFLFKLDLYIAYTISNLLKDTPKA